MSQTSIRDFASFSLLCHRVAQREPHRLTPTRPIWIFGAGQFGRDAGLVLKQEGFDLQGFVESAPRNRLVLGLPVLTWAQLQPNQFAAQLVVGIFNRSMPLDELEALARLAGFTDIFMPWDLYAQFAQLLGWRFWLSTSSVILENRSSIEQVYKGLADEESRQCLLGVLAFRLGQYNAYASFNHADPQYFNDLTLSCLANRKVRYIDGGAYNGDTFRQLADQIELSCAYLFEPDPDNFRVLVCAVKKFSSSATCLPLALADRYRMLSFNAGNGEGGSINEQGTVSIAAVGLDEIFPGQQQVDFIKLDVEGSEMLALRGSEALIKRSRPVLAISLYHRPEDIWEITGYLFNVCENYSFYIRQHFFNSFDVVLYAIPTQLSQS